MSLVIRLARTGKRGERKFLVVVKEKNSKRDGRPVDILGSYIKRLGSEEKKINMEKIEYWKSKGAQLSVGIKKIL